MELREYKTIWLIRETVRWRASRRCCIRIDFVLTYTSHTVSHTPLALRLAPVLPRGGRPVL